MQSVEEIEGPAHEDIDALASFLGIEEVQFAKALQQFRLVDRHGREVRANVLPNPPIWIFPAELDKKINFYFFQQLR